MQIASSFPSHTKSDNMLAVELFRDEQLGYLIWSGLPLHAHEWPDIWDPVDDILATAWSDFDKLMGTTPYHERDLA